MTAAFQQHEPSRSEAAALSGNTTPEQRAAAASHLAHDARNWLTVLQVYCDLLRTSGTVAGHGRTWIEELSNAVERGQGLVTSLLDSAQTSALLESSPVETVAAGPNTLDLAVVIQTREPLFQRMAGNTIRVESKIVAHAETTALQEPEFDRILLNLVRNGIDAMPRGGRLTIELEHGVPSERRPLVLRVSDSGNGIPADILPRIFDSGFSTKAAKQHPKCGRGYGLAIVRELDACCRRLDPGSFSRWPWHLLHHRATQAPGSDNRSATAKHRTRVEQSHADTRSYPAIQQF